MRHRGDRGSVAVELVLLVPVLMLLAGLLLAGGRIWLARTAATDAAYSAARSASLARSAAEAQIDGTAQGIAALDAGGLDCAAATVDVGTSGFGIPVGTPAAVTADVHCDVALSDLVVPGLPGRMSIDAHGAAALDTYRARR